MTTNKVPTCTACGIALKLRTPLRSAARWVHTAIPPVPHVAETDAAIPAAATDEQRQAAESLRFDAILDMEKEARITRAVAGMVVGGGALDLRDQERLYAAVDALTPAEMAAFGEYRKGH
jgi:hypothetical protein